MTVEPTNRGHVQPSKTGKPSEAKAAHHPNTKKKAAATLPSTVTDKVEFSAAAQQLHQLKGAEQIDANTIPAERLNEILKRVADGFYDTPEVIDETTKRAAEDI